MFKRLCIHLFLYLFIVTGAYTQVNDAEKSNLTLLCIAAHPDDEDGATLAYYSKIKGYYTYTIIYTRGEGGQNETGPELYDELGKIREKETYEAAEIQGSKAFFLGMLDFGFSKTAKETFRIWGGKDIVLARIVYMIRKIKPDVVITNHDTITTKPDRQHGHHQAVGLTVFEAFDKAADSNYHPEDIDKSISQSIFLQGGHTTQEIKVYTKPWQVKKLYFRVYDTTKTNNIVTIDMNQTETSGKTIKQIAIDALAKHRTQGMDKIDYTSTMSEFRERRYELVRSDKDYPYDNSDLFSGITPEKKHDVSFYSFTTEYKYNTLSKEDSLKILAQLKYTKNFRIGLVKTYDNTIENFFSGLGIDYSLIDSAMLANRQMYDYDVILLDMRAFLYRNDLVQYNDRILDFVKEGGNVICFYNKPGDWNTDAQLAPYPIFITPERVTEEDAPVTVLNPDHKYFNMPNKIKTEDWNGWVQERNIYLPSDDTAKTSPVYEKLLAMQDEDDPVPQTSLLWAMFGKGTYTYCSLALYRQLKIFNTGGAKLFLNMISQKNKSHKGIENIR
ncbi:MAG: PIG-L family deacetylase [Ignavibacteriae bacterium]|nr:MAG: PIG-L family deacetylase [Ignavibacteriota bacterium]